VKKSSESYRQRRSSTPGADARRRVLAEWRGVDLDPIEKAKANTAKSISDIIPQVTKELRLEKKQAETEILKVWNNLVDPNVAAHAQPTGIHNGTVFVTVDSSVWLDEIVRYRRKEILERLQNSFGRELIKRISFRVG
jgi:predicted nucleic acid-binding Zn ribbon protein